MAAINATEGVREIAPPEASMFTPTSHCLRRCLSWRFRRTFALCAALGIATLAPSMAAAQTLGPLVKQLVAQPKACKMPAPFKLIDAAVSYRGKAVAGGKAVDPRNGYRPIDFDGDGVCEVLAETCNAATGVRDGDALMCPDSWAMPLKWKAAVWQAAYDIGTGAGTERWHGDVTFFYFDRNTGQLRLAAEHNFFANASALPAMVVSLYESGKGQVRLIDCDVNSNEGPAQKGGVLTEFLVLHANRIMDEYEWRLQHCGSPNGFRDTDSQSARLDDLGEILRQLLGGSVDPSKPAGSGSDPATVAWQQRDRQLLDIVTPKALAGCQQHGGYKDIAGAQ